MDARRHWGTLALASTISLCGPSTFAQDAGKDNLTEVIVTGSRIARQNLDAPTPVTELKTDELMSTSVTSIGDVLSDLPSLRGTFTSANSTRFIGTAGVNFLDLRGLGDARTLVLVNGRRHVSGTDGSLQVDVNTIPLDLLERVDIVTGGASSIYGSDAVSGVVNFVLKQNYEGLQLKAQTGLSSRGDNNDSFVSVIGGLNFMEGRGNVAVALEWGKEDAFAMPDRAFTRERQQFVVSSADPTGRSSDGVPDRTFITDARSPNLTEGGVFIPSFQPGVTNATVPPALRNRPENGQPRIFGFNPDGTLTELNYGTDFRPFASTTNGGTGTTLRRYGDLTPEIERKAFNMITHVDLTDSIRWFLEGKFIEVSTLTYSSPSFNQTVSAATPAATGSGALQVRLDNPYLTTQARNVIVPLLPAGATRFNLNRNNLDVGIRGEDTDRETARFVTGFDGSITDHLKYEMSVNYGRTKVNTDVLGNRYERQLRLAVDAARAADGSIVCRSRLNAANVVVVTGDPIIDSCIPVNLLGDGNASAAANAYINADSTFEATIEQKVANAYVSYDSGGWFELPGGPLGFALGGEYRKESSAAAYSEDVSGGLTFLNAIQPLDKSYSVKEAFAEIHIPILADMFLADQLSLDGSYRVADYTLENTSTISAWNGGLQWAPVDDIRFRVGLGQSVRAPTLGDLYQPLTQNFTTVRDPCDVNNISQGRSTRPTNCAAAGVPAGFVNTVARTQTIEIRSGGNSGLAEEQSRSFTVGTVIQPRWVPGLAVTVDYYEIEIEDVIASVTAQQILDNCYDSASLDNMFCPLVFRDPATSLFYANGNGPIGGGVLQSTLNYAARKARGIDAEVSYQLEWSSVGQFNTRLLGTYVRQRDNYPFLDQPNRPDQIVEELGDPKYSLNFDLGYKRNELEIQYGLRWLESQYVDFIENIRTVGGMPPQNPDFSDIAWTGSVMYHDLRAAYTFKDWINVYVGVDNFTDELPPLGFTGTGAGSGIYSNTGRFYYGGVKLDF